MQFIAPLFTPDFYGKEGTTHFYSYAAYDNIGTDLQNTGNHSRAGYPDPSRTFSIRVAAKEARP